MRTFLSAFLVLWALGHATAADFIVTNTNDSGPGSLRQALIDGEAAPIRPSVIKFQIPGEGVHTIILASALPTVPYKGVVDGYSQPGSRPNSLSTGTDAVLLVEVDASAVPGRTAITFGQFYSVVQGLVLKGDVLMPDRVSNQISGCYIGTDASGLVATASGGSVRMPGGDNSGSNIIGGTTPADRNVIATSISIGSDFPTYSRSNKIQGNYVGVAADGVSFLNPGALIFLSRADGSTIGGSTVGAGNVVAGGIQILNTNGAVVEGNLIGTTGMVASPGATGLSLAGSTRFPGTANSNFVSHNVIVSSKSNSAAVVFGSNTSNNIFRGNFVGVGADGKTPLGNSNWGISFTPYYPPSNNTIGGPLPDDGNTIRFAKAAGTDATLPPPAGIIDQNGNGKNVFSGNSILGTGGLGIDLATSGVTPNDPGDADGVQNFPVLTSAVFAGGNVRITGSLNSVANTTFSIEFFGNDSADPSGYGQGQIYLGSTAVTTDANGDGSFDVTVPVPASVTAISSTATGPAGTSEFSASVFAKLLNISTRANVQTGENIAIAGFIITGTDAKTVLLRGIGPSMTVGGVPVAERLVDPLLEVRDSANALLARNDNWEQSQGSDIEATGAAPTDSKESAVLLSLAPGAYTVQLSGAHQQTGIGLVELYDLTPSGSQLANISTRSLVKTGNKIMIAGCIVAPNTGRSSKILVRGIGPSLSGISDPLADPIIELYDANGLLLAANDDWKTNQAEVEASGIAPSEDQESALVADLVPASYTVLLRGKNDSTGVGVIEIYRLP